MAIRQMQWAFGITNMPGGQSYTLGGPNPLHIDAGPYGSVVQSAYAVDPTGTDVGYVVPSGKALALTHAAIESKLAWWGNYQLPKMKIDVPAFAAPFNGSSIAYPPVTQTLRPYSQAEDPNEPNAQPAGVLASTYLVIPGVGSINDTEVSRHWRPPLVLVSGARLMFNVSNNHGGQSIGVLVQGLLIDVAAGEDPLEVIGALALV